MKKIIAVVLVLMFVLTPLSVLAAETDSVEVIDTGTYQEKETGDTITVETIDAASLRLFLEDEEDTLSEKTSITRIYRNGTYEETICVDFKTDQIVHEYADGTVEIQRLSDVVTVVEAEPSEDALPDEMLTEYSADGGVVPFSTNYFYNEPLEVTSSGTQVDLTGADLFYGYRLVGVSSTTWAPQYEGYLLRRNAGVTKTYYSNQFKFSAGTTISTAASIILAAAGSKGISLVASLVVSALSPIIETIEYDWGSLFEVK